MHRKPHNNINRHTWLGFGVGCGKKRSPLTLDTARQRSIDPMTVSTSLQRNFRTDLVFRSESSPEKQIDRGLIMFLTILHASFGVVPGADQSTGSLPNQPIHTITYYVVLTNDESITRLCIRDDHSTSAARPQGNRARTPNVCKGDQGMGMRWIQPRYVVLTIEFPRAWNTKFKSCP